MSTASLEEMTLAEAKAEVTRLYDARRMDFLAYGAMQEAAIEEYKKLAEFHIKMMLNKNFKAELKNV